MNNEQLLSSSDAAKILNVSIRTLGRWARLRKGPPRIKVGRTIYYRMDAIDQWLLSIEGAA